MSKPKPVLTPVEETPGTKILTEEEKAKIDADREKDDIFRSDQGLAKFKIELMFTKEFSITKPVPGVISFWESGTKLHGGGDALIHFCPGKKLGTNECQSHIPDPAHGYGLLVCPACKTVWKGDQVYGQIIGRHTAQQWANLICTYFRRLEMRCDIVIKYHSSDIRNATVQRFNNDALQSVRSGQKRRKSIYTLASLLKDMSAGAELYDRVLAFVRS